MEISGICGRIADGPAMTSRREQVQPFSTAGLEPTGHPREVFGRLAELAKTTRTIIVPVEQAAGLVTAEPLKADRDSPPFDASAVDGFAVTRDAFNNINTIIPLALAAVVMGCAPPILQPGQAIAVPTGGPVPAGACAVIPLEDVIQQAAGIRIRPAAAANPQNTNIRKQGENARAGTVILPVGRLIHPAAAAGLAAFGYAHVAVHAPVEVTLISTGDELMSVHEPHKPNAQNAPNVPDEPNEPQWRIRDSNGPALRVAVGAVKWLHLRRILHVPDNLESLAAALHEALTDCQSIILTGGVSVGARDFARPAIESVGGKVQFHRLAIKPGRPVLGAIGPARQSIFGLPGNPVSAQVLFRAFVLDVLATQAGLTEVRGADALLHLAEPTDSLPTMHWFRPVRRLGPDRAVCLPGRGSGDIPMMAGSDGFVEIYPGASGSGPYPFYRWSGS